ncbi:hypothetical protein QL285_060899 [Trifolium repens]|nr:hypothetical protein QL285_060899 [Trifolium repens]
MYSNIRSHNLSYGKKVILPSSFSTVLIPNKWYGEVPPDFVKFSDSNTKKIWYIWDDQGFQRALSYNKDHVIPILANGWFALLSHYKILQPTEITFSYFGNGTFLISVGKRLYSTNEYPSFHSYSTKPNCTSYFDIVLSKYAATSSQLTLQKDFSDYVRSTQEGSVLLCNQQIEVIKSLILLRGPPKPTTKFGSGWREFCRMNKYQEGDKIRFKFGGQLRNNLIHVRRL